MEISVIGVPMDLGADRRGVDMGPSAIRYADLGDKLRALNKEEEVYDFYVELLKDCPDYPGKRDIVQRLVPLARKLNKNADVEKYEAELKHLSSLAK